MAENAVNNEESLNSQSSQLEEEDLQKLESDSVPVNTKTDLLQLVFKEIYSAAREAKNEL